MHLSYHIQPLTLYMYIYLAIVRVSAEMESRLIWLAANKMIN